MRTLTKKNTIIAITLLTIIIALIPNTIQASDTPLLESPLSGAIYLSEHMWNGSFSINVTVPNGFDFQQMHDYLKMLYPESFSLTWSAVSTHATIKIQMADIEKMKSAQKAAMEIAKNYTGPSMSSREKALALSEYLLDNCEYDFYAEKHPDTASPDAFSPYGALINGQAVCDGYSTAYALLCHYAGIDCIYIGSEQMNHSWNALCINGQIVYTDLAFQDTAESGDFLLVTKQSLSKTHQWDNNFAETMIDGLWPQNQRASQNLSYLGLLQGTGAGLELSRKPTREECAILMIRLMGREEAAQAFNTPCPFVDVPNSGYISFLYSKGIVKGVSDEYFYPNQDVNLDELLTMLLRVMGYMDGYDFSVFSVRQDAVKLGIMSQGDITRLEGIPFDRGAMCFAVSNALKSPCRNGITLEEALRLSLLRFAAGDDQGVLFR